jgi:hypothetical protein
MILIISYEDNEHVDDVRRHLTMPATVVNTAWFPSRAALSASFTSGAEELHLRLPDGSCLDLAGVGAVWYRRISPLGIAEEITDPTARLFAWSESNEALFGMWYSLNCYWMNPPRSDEIAQRKIHQLQLARRLGLSIPETLVTNEPELALDFIRAHAPRKVIRKAFRNIAEAPSPTSVVEEADLELIAAVRYAPVIFQAYVPVDVDLRVTVIEYDVFAAAIRSRPEFHADYRVGLSSATVEPYELPADVSEKLLAMMEALDLRFGAIDLRVTPEGEHVFLEINPAGEYLFVSRRTNQPVSAAIAACLERHDCANC